jgi:hypothetical protein
LTHRTWLTACLLLAALWGVSPAVLRGQGAIVDRVLAVVDGRLVTLSDVRTAVALGFVQSPDEPAALGELVDRLLVVGEASRYSVQDPPAAAIDARLVALRERIGEPAFATASRLGGVSEASLRQHIKEDLLVASYMAQRFASPAVPTDAEVEEYVLAHRDELRAPKGADVSQEDLVRLARERLAGEGRARLVSDWVAGLRRRAEISLRPSTP